MTNNKELMEQARLIPKEIVEKEVSRQAEFGYEPGWEDFVIAGIKEGKRQERERIGTVCFKIERERDMLLPVELWQALKSEEEQDEQDS